MSLSAGTLRHSERKSQRWLSQCRCHGPDRDDEDRVEWAGGLHFAVGIEHCCPVAVDD